MKMKHYHAPGTALENEGLDSSRRRGSRTKRQEPELTKRYKLQKPGRTALAGLLGRETGVL